MNDAKQADPFLTLGVKPDAPEAEIRARYLNLVKQFPPEQNPDEFRRIHSAYTAVKDPLELARRLVGPPEDVVPPWAELVEKHESEPPSISVGLLLALGNKSSSEGTTHRVDKSHE